MKSKPTKRDIMIVEHFVKKTTKSMMNEGYTEDQLNKIEVGGEYPAKFMIKSSSGNTNYISITQESAKSLMKWLNKNMKSFSAQ